MYKIKKTFAVSAPLRLSLAGGGTDLPEYYLKSETKLLSVAINERINIVCGKNIQHDSSELTNLFQQKCHGYNVKVESNINPGNGLGGSGALAVALVAAQNHVNNISKSPLDIALEAYYWERNILNKSVGFQDQVASAYGGCTEMRAFPNGKIEAFKRDDLIKPLDNLLQKNLIFVETNQNRDADNLLKKLAKSFDEIGTKKLNPADFNDVENVILEENERDFGKLLKAHWENKKKRLESSTTEKIDEIINYAENQGALGAKVIGAGGGGFILLCASDKNKNNLCKKLLNSGYTIREYKVDQNGIILKELL
ncbi:MAG: hypothetical protein FWC41_08295 [Firmicutes bacterium]|nr:hypothetical protein [Bacillota bacterium]